MSQDIDVNAFSETLNDKLDRDLKNSAFNMDLVIAYKAPTQDDPTWYRQYKSGWVEQGGYYANEYTGTSSGTPSISLIKTMQDTNYYISRTPRWTESQTSDNLWYMGYQTKTVNSFSVKVYGSSYLIGFEWEVKGFAANPEDSGDDESTYGNVYKTYFYRNTDLDYEHMVGPYTPSQMAAYSIPGSGVIMGYVNPDNSNNGRLKINDHIVWGADYYYTSVYIPVKKNDVFSYVGIDDPTTSGQLWFVPYLEPSQSTDPSVTTLVDALYPVGSIYIGTTVNCPLASIVGTWEKIDGDLVLQSSSQAHQANTTIEAGLPNIEGAAGIGVWNTGQQTTTYNHGLNWIDVQGSLYITESTNTISNWSETTSGNKTSWTAKANRVGIDASRSSEVYGNSDTVQPPAYVVNVWRRTA